MSNIKQMANMAIIEFEDGTIQCVITSHPNGNNLEQACEAVVSIMNEVIKAERKNPGCMQRAASATKEDPQPQDVDQSLSDLCTTAPAIGARKP